MRFTRIPAFFAASGMLLCGLGAPAEAHSSDPRIVTTVDQVAPELPHDVVIQARSGIASQLVAANPTEAPLEVLGRDGAPFLRLSRTGVEANLASADFYETSNPNGSLAAVPAAVRASPAASARWVRISDGDSWGWYDHRLHPASYPVPSDQRIPAVLARFEVPFRYGTTAVRVTGQIVFTPLLGGLRVDGPAPVAGIAVDVLQGRLPGLLLRVTTAESVIVRGRDGEAFLRIAGRGVEVNVASRTYVEDRQARGEFAGPPGIDARWRVVGGTSYSWLDARLRYEQDAPDSDVRSSGQVRALRRWSVPVEVNGANKQIGGTISWVPVTDTGSGALRDRDSGMNVPGTALKSGVGLLALLMGSMVVIAVRRRLSR
ncbi:MAG: hypothetical protein ABIO67_12475 [Mycobacteriales bacterium]